jgi:hypothetical protein
MSSKSLMPRRVGRTLDRPFSHMRYGWQVGRTKSPSEQKADRAGDKSAQASPSREAFFDEVVDVDEDINQLKVQLAHKLHLQNVQLKNMLKRFDVS